LSSQLVHNIIGSDVQFSFDLVELVRALVKRNGVDCVVHFDWFLMIPKTKKDISHGKILFTFFLSIAHNILKVAALRLEILCS
jgi:hypothetical protein